MDGEAVELTEGGVPITFVIMGGEAYRGDHLTGGGTYS